MIVSDCSERKLKIRTAEENRGGNGTLKER